MFVLAHVSLVNVRDQKSFVVMNVAQNTVFPTSNSTGYSPEAFFKYVSSVLQNSTPESRFVMNSIGGSLFISSRLSITFSNVNLGSCSASTKYDGSSSSSLSAIGGAAALLSSSNPFAKPIRSWFPEPSRVLMSASFFNGNSATCIRNLAFNSNGTVVTVMGGAVALLHSDAFLSPFLNEETEVDQNHNQMVSISSVSFSNNNATAAFPKQDYASSASVPSSASAVVLGGSL